ncbi:hypothetical protein GQ457_04G025500 [Hibiscus cannabinus]
MNKCPKLIQGSTYVGGEKSDACSCVVWLVRGEVRAGSDQNSKTWKANQPKGSMKGAAMVLTFILVSLLSSWVPFVHARIPHFSALKENLDRLSLSGGSAKEDPPGSTSPVPNGMRQPTTPGFRRRRA